jgi:hypothetical protein
MTPKRGHRHHEKADQAHDRQRQEQFAYPKRILARPGNVRFGGACPY